MQDVSKALDELEKKEAADGKSGDDAAAASGDEEDKDKEDEEAEKKVFNHIFVSLSTCR